MFQRTLNITKTNSFFLFGPRGTGKTTYLGNALPAQHTLRIDLLADEYLAQLQADPAALINIIEQVKKEWILVDEVQKVPPLLDVVHLLIEKRRQKFALTGSSARKLKRGSANLLAGRAFVFKMFPLTHTELGAAFDLNEVLSYGTLPKIFDLPSAREKALFLKAYAETYLKEEILIEQLIRNLPPFRRFLEISARQDTELVSYSTIARDILVDPKIVSNYYLILEDTLLGFFLEPFHISLRKRQKAAPKFYWFDLGVRRALSGTVDQPVTPKSFEYGSLFESFLVNEIHRLLTYAERSFKLSFARIDENLEVDLIVERQGLPIYLVEIKSGARINRVHAKGLEKLSASLPKAVPLLLSNDRVAKKFGRVTCMHWQDGLKEMGLLPL